jgi:DNA-binding NarL/FixJ family response regulator
MQMFKVLVVDDHAQMRELVRGALDREPDIHVVGDACNGADAVDLADELEPDVVVMDLSMPGMSGVEATRELLARLPEVAVLVVTVSAAERDVLDALEAGAAGYLLKDSGPEEIVRAVEAAVDGDTPLSPRVAGLIVHRARGRAGDLDASNAGLSDREVEVLRLLAEGLDNNEIALRLYLSPTTVKRHVSAVFAKAGVSNRVQAAIWAVRAGLI